MKNPKIETGTSEELPEGHVVSEEVAVADVKAFVKIYKFRKLDDDVILDTYPEVVLGVQMGLLVFNGAIPSLKLYEPVMDEDGNVALDSIVFKTRVKSSDQVAITKGLDMNNKFLYLNKVTAFLIQQPLAMLDKLGRLDLKIIDQLSTLFT